MANLTKVQREGLVDKILQHLAIGRPSKEDINQMYNTFKYEWDEFKDSGDLGVLIKYGFTPKLHNVCKSKVFNNFKYIPDQTYNSIETIEVGGFRVGVYSNSPITPEVVERELLVAEVEGVSGKEILEVVKSRLKSLL